jgi:hypothetical protein
MSAKTRQHAASQAKTRILGCAFSCSGADLRLTGFSRRIRLDVSSEKAQQCHTGVTSTDDGQRLHILRAPSQPPFHCR